MITALLLLLLRCLLLLTSMTLRVRQRPFLRRPTLFSLTLLPRRSFLRLSLRLLLSVSDSVVNNFYDEYELSEGTQLKVPVSSLDTREVELPDHVDDLFLQTVEGLDLPHDTIKGLKQLLYDHRETFASSSADLGFCPLVEHDIDTGTPGPLNSHHVDHL